MNSRTLKGQTAPDCVTVTLGGAWWVMKGYDRFNKMGGKIHELHGGATLEEQLVPVVVFERGADYVPPVVQTALAPGAGRQMVEDDTFADL